MVVTTLHSRNPDELRQQKLVFRSMGCEIYKDAAGQHYAVATAREIMPDSLSAVFEAERLPEHWVLDTEQE